MTPAAKALGAPFKPYFGLSGLGCLPDLFVIRSELRISYYAALINDHVCGFL
jgi:hypothetical protein